MQLNIYIYYPEKTSPTPSILLHKKHLLNDLNVNVNVIYIVQIKGFNN